MGHPPIKIKREHISDTKHVIHVKYCKGRDKDAPNHIMMIGKIINFPNKNVQQKPKGKSEKNKT